MHFACGTLINDWCFNIPLVTLPNTPAPPQPMSEQGTKQCENRRKSFKVRKTSPILLSNVNKN
jgi:hypothetical protein